jgi:short-subunit dehydrogenase
VQAADMERPLAVITGASTGIGYELARVFAEHDFDLLICAENPELEVAAKELRSMTDVISVRTDLSKPAGVQDLYKWIERTKRPVHSLVLNAGVGAGGDFARDTELDKELGVIDLNVRSTVHLCKLVLQDMVERDEGRILFTSSIASTTPGPFMAVYNASKSFVQSFALAIRNELKDTGVTVTSLMPGPTETRFFERAEMQDTRIGASDKDDPAEVAQRGFEALMDGDAKVVVASLTNKVQASVAGRVLPDGAKAQMNRKQAEPGSAPDDGGES